MELLNSATLGILTAINVTTHIYENIANFFCTFINDL